MENSSRLQLPYIMGSQAQKHVTHNEAVRMLDALVQPAVKGCTLTTPPAAPAEGDGYIVADGASDAWAARDGQIAVFQDGAWAFFTPVAGWQVFDTDAGERLAFSGTAWEPFRGGGALPWFGINGDADATNRLAVKSDVVIVSHDDVTPGTGDARLKVNKAAAGNTASVLFQTGWAGRAECGLTGDDDWHVKVSADGASWNEALVADRSTGAVRFPAGVQHAGTGQTLAGFIFTPGGDGLTSIVRFDRTRSQDPRTAAIGSISSDVITLSTPDADLFFHPFMRDVSYVRIWNTSKSTPEPAWVKYDPASGSSNDQLQVTDAADIAGWAASETIQIGDQDSWPGVPSGFIRGYALDISPMLQNQLGAVFPQKGLTFKCTVFGGTGRAGFTATATGIPGSYIGGNSLSDGTVNITQHTMACTELSPISNSNLVWIREEQDAGGQIGISTLGVVGVWV